MTSNKKQRFAEAYGMGDVKVGQQITGQYPNSPIDPLEASSDPITIRVVSGPVCPRCGSPEVLLGGTVRPFKVDAGRGGWESNCTSCAIWFLEDGTITEG